MLPGLIRFKLFTRNLVDKNWKDKLTTSKEDKYVTHWLMKTK